MVKYLSVSKYPLKLSKFLCQLSWDQILVVSLPQQRSFNQKLITWHSTGLVLLLYLDTVHMYQLSCFCGFRTHSTKHCYKPFPYSTALITNIQVLELRVLITSYVFLICAKLISSNKQFLTLLWYFHTISPLSQDLEIGC